MLIATRARVRVVARIIPQGHPEGHHSSRTFRGASFFEDIPRGLNAVSRRCTVYRWLGLERRLVEYHSALLSLAQGDMRRL